MQMQLDDQFRYTSVAHSNLLQGTRLLHAVQLSPSRPSLADGTAHRSLPHVALDTVVHLLLNPVVVLKLLLQLLVHLGIGYLITCMICKSPDQVLLRSCARGPSVLVQKLVDLLETHLLVVVSTVEPARS